MITDSIFCGVGKTQYQAYQAIITNGTVCVVAFLAYITDLWTPTFDSILTTLFAFRVLFPRHRSLQKGRQEFSGYSIGMIQVVLWSGS